MKIFDRLYGEIKLPRIIMQLLDCPGLLRLRDIRMANNQMFAFPAFASVSRYEHSLGVCSLANHCASSLELTEKNALELMAASLYHDVATPPFAHAMEEVLSSKFDFDHEDYLRKLIQGSAPDVGGTRAQVFWGRGLKLHRVFQSKAARAIGLSVDNVAKLAAGDKTFYLSSLLNSSGMDLDNIDNVIRAVTAMGVAHSSSELPISLSKAYVRHGNIIYYNKLYEDRIREWLMLRNILYTHIFDSVSDFAYQTMIKLAVQLLIKHPKNKIILDEHCWKLSDYEFVHRFLLVHSKTKKIIKRVMLADPFSCYGMFYVKGVNTARFINSNLNIISNCIADFLKSRGYIKQSNIIDESDTYSIVANFFPDKRNRSLREMTIHFGKVSKFSVEQSEENGVVLGLFTPFKARPKEEVLIKLLEFLGTTILRDFKISLYGQKSKAIETPSQTQVKLL